MNILISILIGAVSGWIASIIMKSSGGLIRDIILGIVGGFVGGFVFNLLKVQLPFDDIIATIIVSVVGACIVIFAAKLILKN